MSPSNSTKEIEDKTRGYLAAGATEVWIVDPQGQTIAIHGPGAIKPASDYRIDLEGLFDA